MCFAWIVWNQDLSSCYLLRWPKFQPVFLSTFFFQFCLFLFPEIPIIQMLALLFKSYSALRFSIYFLSFCSDVNVASLFAQMANFYYLIFSFTDFPPPPHFLQSAGSSSTEFPLSVFLFFITKFLFSASLYFLFLCETSYFFAEFSCFFHLFHEYL